MKIIIVITIDAGGGVVVVIVTTLLDSECTICLNTNEKTNYLVYGFVMSFFLDLLLRLD